MTTHIGIQLRIMTPWGPLLVLDSDQLYFKAMLDGDFLEHYNPLMHGPAKGWCEIFPGEGYSFNGSRDLVIQVRPQMLGGFAWSAGPDDEPADEPAESDVGRQRWWRRMTGTVRGRSFRSRRRGGNGGA